MFDTKNVPLLERLRELPEPGHGVLALSSSPETRKAYLDLVYKPDLRRAFFDRLKSGDVSQYDILLLEGALERTISEENWYSEIVDNLQRLTFQIARSYPGPPYPAPPGSPGGYSTMAAYWRWSMWEDCAADTPEQIERMLHALVASMWDFGARSN